MKNSRPSLLFVMYSLEIGGAETQLLHLLRAASGWGARLRLALLEKKGEFQDSLPAGVEVVDLGFRRQSPSSWLFSIWKLRQLLHRMKPSGILASLSLVNLFTHLARFGTSHRPLYAEHSGVALFQDPNAPLSRRLARQVLLSLLPGIYNRGRGLVVLNRAEARGWAGLGVRKRQIRTIPNGFDFENLEARAGGDPALALPGGRRHILTLARVQDPKQPRVAIEAAARLTTPNFFWTWLGTGPDLASMRRLVVERGLADRFAFVGSVTNPFPLLRQAEALVLPSRFESFGNVLVEALYFGVPVVASDCPTGPREILRGGDLGELVPVGDPIPLAATLDRILASPPANDETRRRRREAAVRSYSGLRIFELWRRLLLGGFLFFFLFSPFLLAKTVLILAPHPDDETLSSGGLIQAHLARGDRVLVAILTHGEDFPKAASIHFRRSVAQLRPAEYRTFGAIRRGEASKALSLLGVPEGNTIFLAYPTHGLKSLFRTHWHPLYLSPRTRMSRGRQYWGGIAREVSFQGHGLFKDLVTLLRRQRPEVVIGPMVEDTHDDHEFTARFLDRALAHLRLEYRPGVRLGYFVHFHRAPNYPRPYGYYPGAGMENPPFASNHRWVRYPVPPGFLARKELALRAFATQIDLGDEFLLSFVRREELFADLSGTGR